MKKAAVLIIIGAIFFAAGVFAIYTGFASQSSGENSLVFEKKVTAQITDMRTAESTVGRKKENGTGSDALHTTYTYYVDLLVSDGGNTYAEEQTVSESVYKEYSSLEKNKDMEFNLYRNGDGAAYFSLKDIDGATADYQSVQVTKNIAVRMIAGLIAAAVGWVLLMNGLKTRKNT